jgi:hypothetical protein
VRFPEISTVHAPPAPPPPAQQRAPAPHDLVLAAAAAASAAARLSAAPTHNSAPRRPAVPARALTAAAARRPPRRRRSSKRWSSTSITRCAQRAGGGVRPKSREGWGVGVPGSLGALRARVSAARARGRAVARARRPKFSGSGRRRCVMRYFTCAGPLRTLVGNARVQDRTGGAAPPGAPSIVRSVRAADEEAAPAGARSPAPRCRWRSSC